MRFFSILISLIAICLSALSVAQGVIIREQEKVIKKQGERDEKEE